MLLSAAGLPDPRVGLHGNRNSRLCWSLTAKPLSASAVVAGLSCSSAGLWPPRQLKSALQWTLSKLHQQALPTTSKAGATLELETDHANAAKATAEDPKAHVTDYQNIAEKASEPQTRLSPWLFVSGVAMLPSPEKERGEDAFFVSKNGLSLGIADGVGGWVVVGVDAGKYSRLLMKHCSEAIAKLPLNKDAPQLALQEAWHKTLIRGSCTACLVVLEGNKMHAANLGDSGFLLVRDGKVVFASRPQQQSFNRPYQLAEPSEKEANAPDHSDLYEADLQDQDILITATDGLFDNVHNDDAAMLVTMVSDKGRSALDAAKALAKFAHEKSLDREYMSPFAIAARRQGYNDFKGGKPDDITVIVSYVTPTAPASKL